jgi:hypothetical protein
MTSRLRAPAARRIFSLLFIILIAGLAATTALRLKAGPQQDESRTVNYIHGRIYTNDPQHPWAQAFAVRAAKSRASAHSPT